MWLQKQDVATLPAACEGDDVPDNPRVCVTWYEAEAYAAWRGGSLPSEAQWEFAARGPDSHIYPWGDEFDPLCANLNRRAGLAATNAPDCQSPLAPSRGKLAGGSFPKGASPYGCQDMAGNVWEWVSDVWIERAWFGWASASEPRGILRGGAYSYSPKQARTSYQGFENLAATCHDVGFRCAMDAVVKRK